MKSDDDDGGADGSDPARESIEEDGKEVGRIVGVKTKEEMITELS